MARKIRNQSEMYWKRNALISRNFVLVKNETQIASLISLSPLASRMEGQFDGRTILFKSSLLMEGYDILEGQQGNLLGSIKSLIFSYPKRVYLNQSSDHLSRPQMKGYDVGFKTVEEETRLAFMEGDRCIASVQHDEAGIVFKLDFEVNDHRTNDPPIELIAMILIIFDIFHDSVS